MWTISFIRRHILSLPEGTIFTTRDCLSYGRRGTVDQSLYRLVGVGFIRRLARGVFVRDPGNKKKFSHYDIAKVKAESFGRTIIVALPIPSYFGQSAEHNAVTFFINGRTTRFRINNRVIHLKQNSPRKMTMSKNKAGLHLHALWQVGKEAINDVVVQQATMTFNRTDNLDARKNARLMPAWLCEHFNFGNRWVSVA